MPIFLDRRTFASANPGQVGGAHLTDLARQTRHGGVKVLAYWHDDACAAGFCLIEAPDRATADRVQRELHGEDGGSLVEVDPATAEAFLGRVADPWRAAPARGPPSGGGAAVRAVMFTDIVGSMAMTARLGDRRAVEIVRAHDALVRRALARHGGREVKHTGDGIMASFTAIAAGVACARAILRAFADFNRASVEPIRVRIGLHAGEPVEDGNDLFGAAVQVAARICRGAAADTMVVSGEVRAALGDDPGWVALGELSLKGIAAPVALFQAVGADEA